MTISSVPQPSLERGGLPVPMSLTGSPRRPPFSRPQDQSRPYPFPVRYALAGLALLFVVVLLLAAAIAISGAFSLLKRDTQVAAQLVQAVADAVDLQAEVAPVADLQPPPGPSPLLQHLIRLPGVVSATVYNLDRVAVWSTIPSVIGRHSESAGLRRAVTGGPWSDWDALPVGLELAAALLLDTPAANRPVSQFLPVWDRSKARLVGVVELSRQSHGLVADLGGLAATVAFTALLAWALLGAAGLHALAHLHAGEMDARRRAVATESAAALREIAHAIARDTRDALEPIQASAEQALAGDRTFRRDQAQDILLRVRELDRRGMRLLALVRPFPDGSARLSDAVRGVLTQREEWLRERQVHVQLQLQEPSPVVAMSYDLLAETLDLALEDVVRRQGTGGTVRIRDRGEPGARIAVLAIGALAGGVLPRQDQDVTAAVPLPLIRRVLQAAGADITYAGLRGEPQIALRLPVRREPAEDAAA